MSADGQRTKCCRKITENFNRLSRAHERYRQTNDRRQTTDGRTTTYSEFTFAKNGRFFCIYICSFFYNIFMLCLLEPPVGEAGNLFLNQISIKYIRPRRDKTTSGFGIWPAAILKFYFRFLF